MKTRKNAKNNSKCPEMTLKSKKSRDPEDKIVNFNFPCHETHCEHTLKSRREFHEKYASTP